METTSKHEYIDQWTNYIKQLYTLAFCSNEELSEDCRQHIEGLSDLVPKIAETKTFKYN